MLGFLHEIPHPLKSLMLSSFNRSSFRALFPLSPHSAESHREADHPNKLRSYLGIERKATKGPLFSSALSGTSHACIGVGAAAHKQV